MSWYNEMGNELDTVISSRIRLARNISGYPFGDRLTPESAERIISDISSLFENEGFTKTDFSALSKTEAVSYVEKHFVSPEFSSKKGPHSLLLCEKTGTAIMVCEEDHIRLQTIRSGLALREAYSIASEYDDMLDGRFNIAYDEKLGYLTHCPTNLGTGMRASVMMFLPALTMANGISALASQLSKIGLTMRGLYGEGSKGEGCLYQISNQITLGITEEDTLKKLSDIITQINDKERKLRMSVKGENLENLKDTVLRSEGILKYAHMMTSAEFLKHFANIRLGISLGIITDISYPVLGDLFIKTMPATLALAEKPETERERDRKRAYLIKKTLMA